MNTTRVSTGEKGMYHREGGWPETIDLTEPQQYTRFMKKIDKDQNFAQQVKSLCEVAERCMLKNKQIDMFEEYFVNEESDHVVENISTKTLMLFKYPPLYQGTRPMSASAVSARSPGTPKEPPSWQSPTPSPGSSRPPTK